MSNDQRPQGLLDLNPRPVQRQRIENPVLRPVAAPAENPPRCSTMAPGERTMASVLDDFKEQYQYTNKISESFVNSYLDIFLYSLSLYWRCPGHGCKYRESPKSSAHAYAISHGAKEIADNIGSFCNYYLIRKCMSSTSDNRKVSTIMSKLTDYLHNQGIIDLEVKKDVKKQLRDCNAVDGDKIMSALSKLKAEGYWRDLPPQNPDDDYEAADEGEIYDSSIGGEMGLTVRNITDEGWVFEQPSIYGLYEDIDDGVDGPLLRLPPNVAKMGRVGMRFSCLRLGSLTNNGAYEPYNEDFSLGGENVLYAGVYPF